MTKTITIHGDTYTLVGTSGHPRAMGGEIARVRISGPHMKTRTARMPMRKWHGLCRLAD